MAEEKSTTVPQFFDSMCNSVWLACAFDTVATLTKLAQEYDGRDDVTYRGHLLWAAKVISDVGCEAADRMTEQESTRQS